VAGLGQGVTTAGNFGPKAEQEKKFAPAGGGSRFY